MTAIWQNDGAEWRLLAPTRFPDEQTLPALFLARLLRGETLTRALSMTASAVHAVLEETHRMDSREMRLVAAQESIADPPWWFEARRVR